MRKPCLHLRASKYEVLQLGTLVIRARSLTKRVGRDSGNIYTQWMPLFTVDILWHNNGPRASFPRATIKCPTRFNLCRPRSVHSFSLHLKQSDPKTRAHHNAEIMTLGACMDYQGPSLLHFDMSKHAPLPHKIGFSGRRLTPQ